MSRRPRPGSHSELPVALDQDARRRVILAKQLANAAQRGTAPLRGYNAQHAVIVLDAAIETMLFAIAGALHRDVRAYAPTFQGLLDQASTLISQRGGQLSHWAGVSRLHEIRNDAQHKARIPSEEELSEAITHARDFLRDSVATVWGASIEALTQSDVVQHERCRELLQQAEGKLASGEERPAARLAYQALSLALLLVQGAFSGRPLQRWSSFSGRTGDRHFDRELESLSDAVRRMQETMAHTSLGLDYADLLRCQRATGSLIWMAGGGVHWLDDPQVDRTLADWVVTYCVDSVVMIEARVGDLSAPFGLDR